MILGRARVATGSTKRRCGLRPLAIAVVATVAACAGREWVREYEGFLPGDEPYVSVFLVRDKRTGSPVAGALVRQRFEWDVDRDGSWAPLGVEGTTDAYGLVSFDLGDDPGPCHWTVHAAGYAPAEEYGNVLTTVVELERGWECAGRLRAPDGRPLPGVLVEYKLGCAHAPALATATTDADGVFVFPRVEDGDFTYEDPRFAAGYWLGPGPRDRRWGVPENVVPPGAFLRGTVRFPDGRPAVGSVVTIGARAPRAVVDGAGHFMLGRLDDDSPTLAIFWEGGLDEVPTADFRPGGPVTVRLPSPDGLPEAEADDEAAAVRVVVRVRDGQGKPPERCLVNLDREPDHRHFAYDMGWWERGDAELLVPPGTYELSAGSPASRYVAAPRRLVVPGPLEVDLVVTEQPSLRIEPPVQATEGFDEFDFRIALTDRSWTFDPEDEAPACLPADGAAWLHVSTGRGTFVYPIGPAHDGVRRVVTALPGRKRLAFPELAGHEFQAYLFPPGEESLDGDDMLPTFAVGECWLVVVHPVRGRAMRRLVLPRTAAAPIEIRDLAFDPPSPEREVRVERADGTPLEDATVTFLERGSPQGPGWEAEDWAQTGAPGVVASVAARAGACVVVSHPQYLTTWRVLEGDGPYTVRFGDAAVEIELGRVGPEPTLVVDGCSIRSYELKQRVGQHTDDDLVLRGTVRLAGLDAGPHTVLVGATDRFVEVRRIVLAAGETRRIAPVLRERGRARAREEAED